MNSVILDDHLGSVLVVADERPGTALIVERERTEVVTTAEQGPPGPAGPAGANGPPGEPGLRVTGAVATADQLPDSANSGEVFVTRDDGNGYAWNGAAWVHIGPIAIQGPAGAKGKDGQIRYTGHGAPGVILGAEPGDTYLDLLTGEIYKLS